MVAAVLLAIAFTVLFLRKEQGINLIIYEAILIAVMVYFKRISLKNTQSLIAFVAFAITALFTVLTHSQFVYTMHFISASIFAGTIALPNLRSYFTAIEQACVSTFQSQALFVKNIAEMNIFSKNVLFYLKKARFILLPALVIFFFMFLYRLSSEVFDNIIGKAFSIVGDAFVAFFENVDFFAGLLFIAGLFVANFFIFNYKSDKISERENKQSDSISRMKSNVKRKFSNIALKTELRVGVFMFLSLNAMLLLLNVTDVFHVWIHFEWKGQLLKHYVHSGTWLLIVSILLSIVIVLHYFRANLNYYQKNKWLKILAYVWIFQNVFLAISVAMRNYHYISHFNLAYKRIGVFIFLAMTIVGLWTVFVKVKHKKSAFFLLRWNVFSVFVILCLSSLFPWDIVIAKYNFRNAEKAFVHFNFMGDLSDKSLPYLDIPKEKLLLIEENQSKIFHFHRNYMDAETFYNKIQFRKKTFIQNWEQSSVLEWNLPDYLAYKKLKPNLE